jgi:hypothetical protein
MKPSLFLSACLLAIVVGVSSQSSSDPGSVSNASNTEASKSESATSKSEAPTSDPPGPTPPPDDPSKSSTSQSVFLSKSEFVSKDPDGNTHIIEVDVTVTAPPPTNSDNNNANTDKSKESGVPTPKSGISTGAIVGLSVAGGIGLICVAAFFIWKFTQKRSRDFDDGEAIKWPELNSHSGADTDSHALPVNPTGRAGFATGSDLSRTPSHSTYSVEDPYSVPPLPHMNPNQGGPYRDDPNAGGAYYDPYNGPVPQTFNEAHGAPPAEWGHNEAIAMTQMGRASPGPGMMGRASPGPGMMGRASPGPGMIYDGGRASPGPGMVGRASPGPGMLYDGGQAGYAGRVASPGPQAAYGGQQ